MKAIHNYRLLYDDFEKAVNYTQRYKKWKQFTTADEELYYRWELWTIHKDTKNESNSQLHSLRYIATISCELYTKIQKMKAIHNYSPFLAFFKAAVNYTQRYKKWKQFTTEVLPSHFGIRLWTIHKDTKNESNSQLR